MNLRILLLSAAASARTTPLGPLSAAAGLAAGLAALAARTGDPDLALMGARAATTALAAGIAFSLDDPASRSTGAVVHPLRYRRLARVACAGVVWAAVLGAVLWLVTAMLPPDQTPLPIWRLVLEAGGQAALGLALAAWLSHHDPRPGRVAAGIVLGAVLVSWLLPPPWRPWLHPADPRWETGERVWTTILVIGVGLLVASSWDSRSGSFASRLRNSD